jgi:hypothetical protein
MAGDWIKMRVDLADDPAVIALVDKTGLDDDHVVGKLHRLWSWADRQTIDGNAVSVTKAWLDRYLEHSGFAEALVGVGWLVVEPDGLRFPNFDRHNGQTAKARALTAKRVAKCRASKSNGVSVTGPLPEKRREENTSMSDFVGRDTAAFAKNDASQEEGAGAEQEPAAFTSFYLAYPKKQKRRDAAKAWRRLNPSPELVQTIMAALAHFKASPGWQRNNGQYIPLPASWINDCRWEDEGVTEAPKPTKQHILTREEIEAFNAGRIATN